MEKTQAKKIMVIDDDPDYREAVTTILKSAMYDVVVASNPKEGKERVLEEKPDLICLDLHMPNQTGTGFYRKLSRDKELADTPVIVVSGLAGRELAVREPAAVFDKPIDPEEFLEAVEAALA